MQKQLKQRFQAILAELKTEMPATKHYVLDEMQRIVGETRRELATTKQQRESAVASNQLLTERLAKSESQLSETNERLKNTKSTMESLRRAKDEYEKQAKELDLWFSMLQEIVENSLPKILSKGVRSLIAKGAISEDFIACLFLESAFFRTTSGLATSTIRMLSTSGDVEFIIHTGEWHPDEESAVRFFLPDEFKKACPADIWKDLEKLSPTLTSIA